LQKKALSRAQWDELLARLLTDLAKLHISAPKEKITEGYARANKFLVDHGRKQAEVDAMPQSQIILLFSSLFTKS
jgi:hypothetical protein